MLRERIDRSAIARYGFNATDVLDVVETVGSKPLGTVLEGEEGFVLQARFGGDPRAHLDRIRDLRVSASPTGAGVSHLIPLSQLADIRIEDGPAQIRRDKIRRRINVEANVRGRDLASFVSEGQEAVGGGVDPSPGWIVDWGGQFENLQAASLAVSSASMGWTAPRRSRSLSEPPVRSPSGG